MATFWFRLVRVRVEETDLSVMLGNLYENAIEASLKIEDTSKRYIRIEIACMEGNLIISYSSHYFSNYNWKKVVKLPVNTIL